MIEFFIPGVPVPKGRARAAVINGHAHVFTPGKTRGYENLVKMAGSKAMKGAAPFDVPLALSIAVCLPVPGSWSEKKRQQALRGDLLPAKRPDASNCAKAVEDGLNSVCYADDALVCELHVSKRYAAVAGVYVRLEELESDAGKRVQWYGSVSRLELLPAANPF